jgi:hypothetical protein
VKWQSAQRFDRLSATVNAALPQRGQ